MEAEGVNVLWLILGGALLTLTLMINSTIETMSKDTEQKDDEKKAQTERIRKKRKINRRFQKR